MSRATKKDGTFLFNVNQKHPDFGFTQTDNLSDPLCYWKETEEFLVTSYLILIGSTFTSYGRISTRIKKKGLICGGSFPRDYNYCGDRICPHFDTFSGTSWKHDSVSRPGHSGSYGADQMASLIVFVATAGVVDGCVFRSFIIDI